MYPIRCFFKKHLFHLVLALAISMMTVPAFAKQGDAALPAVKLVYWRSIDDLPLYVGVEKGFFEQAGVNVELEYIKSEANTLAAVLRGDVNGGIISLASLIKLAEKKNPGQSGDLDRACP